MIWNLLRLCHISQNKAQPTLLAYLLPLSLAWALAGCGQDFNSHSGDSPVSQLSADVCESEAGARFCAARAIFEANCFSCHPSWADLDSDERWQGSGLVVPGDTGQSRAINRLINAGSNMPLGGDALSADDYAVLLDWVLQMSWVEE